MKYLVLLFVISLCACEVQDHSCPKHKEHDWGKWEPTPKPEVYRDGCLSQKRECLNCGLGEARSYMP